MWWMSPRRSEANTVSPNKTGQVCDLSGWFRRQPFLMYFPAGF